MIVVMNNNNAHSALRHSYLALIFNFVITLLVVQHGVSVDDEGMVYAYQSQQLAFLSLQLSKAYS